MPLITYRTDQTESRGVSCVCTVPGLPCQSIQSCLLSCAMGLLLQQCAVRHMLAQQQAGTVILLSTAAPSCSSQTAICCCCRQAQQAVCRQTWLVKHGKLVLISQHGLSSSVADLATYLQQDLEAVAGGSPLLLLNLSPTKLNKLAAETTSSSCQAKASTSCLPIDKRCMKHMVSACTTWCSVQT